MGAMGHGTANNGKRRSRRVPILVACIIVLAGVAFAVVAHFAWGADAFAPFRNAAGADADAGVQVGVDAGAASESGVLRAEGVAVDANGLSEGRDAAQENSRYFQELIDWVSESGGGTVNVPAGEFYFAATGRYHAAHYAIRARDNVAIVGAGADATTFLPYGTWRDNDDYVTGIDLFWYDGIGTKTYLVNADFRDFTVDGAYARGRAGAYNASGKGFFFKLFRDCDWSGVVVKNTDGTGFGVDFPINSTIRNCVAIECGKNADEDSFGASGFGIGTGYSQAESIVIENCESYDNTKYGFFFEHQSLYRSYIKANRASGFEVRGCVASGNLYNYGGKRAYDVSYVRCVSAVSDDDDRESYTRSAYKLEDHTVRVTFTDCQIEQSVSDVKAGDEGYDAVHWALDAGIVESASADERAFRPNDAATRAEVAFMLWRLEGWPGDLPIGGEVHPTGVTDVTPDHSAADAVRWLRDAGLSVADEFRPDDAATRAEFATMLWRLATGDDDDSGVADEGSIGVDDVSQQAGAAPAAPYYAEAVQWAVDNGLMTAYQASLANDPVTRTEAVEMLHAYDLVREAE